MQQSLNHTMYIAINVTFEKDYLSHFMSGHYIGQKLRENGFDPKGKGSSSKLDDQVRICFILSPLQSVG